VKITSDKVTKLNALEGNVRANKEAVRAFRSFIEHAEHAFL
jgi:hypothetical protein